MLEPGNRLTEMFMPSHIGLTRTLAEDYHGFSELMLASVGIEPYSFNRLRLSRLTMQRGLEKRRDDAARVLGWHDTPRVD